MHSSLTDFCPFMYFINISRHTPRHRALQGKKDQTTERTRRGTLLHLSAAAAMFKSELCFYFKIHQRLPRSIRDIAVSASNTQAGGINKGNVIFFAISVFHFPLFRLDIINCVLGSTSYLVQTPVFWCPDCADCVSPCSSFAQSNSE